VGERCRCSAIIEIKRLGIKERYYTSLDGGKEKERLGGKENRVPKSSDKEEPYSVTIVSPARGEKNKRGIVETTKSFREAGGIVAG